MAGMAGRRVGLLTARQVQTAKQPGLYGDGGNLFLKVDDGGSKSWMFRHQIDGKVRKYGLGSTHTVSLIDARERAEAVRRQLLDGIDPREARRAEREAAAVARIAESCALNAWPAQRSRCKMSAFDPKRTSQLGRGTPCSKVYPAGSLVGGFGH